MLLNVESIKHTIKSSFPNIKNLNVYKTDDGQIRWDFDQDEIHTRRSILTCVVNPVLEQAAAEWNREHAEDCIPDKAVRISAKLEFKD